MKYIEKETKDWEDEFDELADRMGLRMDIGDEQTEKIVDFIRQTIAKEKLNIKK